MNKQTGWLLSLILVLPLGAHAAPQSHDQLVLVDGQVLQGRVTREEPQCLDFEDSSGQTRCFTWGSIQEVIKDGCFTSDSLRELKRHRIATDVRSCPAQAMPVPPPAPRSNSTGLRLFGEASAATLSEMITGVGYMGLAVGGSALCSASWCNLERIPGPVIVGLPMLALSSSAGLAVWAAGDQQGGQGQLGWSILGGVVGGGVGIASAMAIWTNQLNNGWAAYDPYPGLAALTLSPIAGAMVAYEASNLAGHARGHAARTVWVPFVSPLKEGAVAGVSRAF